jgi:hypothetical protein
MNVVIPPNRKETNRVLDLMISKRHDFTVSFSGDYSHRECPYCEQGDFHLPVLRLESIKTTLIACQRPVWQVMPVSVCNSIFMPVAGHLQ